MLPAVNLHTKQGIYNGPALVIRNGMWVFWEVSVFHREFLL